MLSTRSLKQSPGQAFEVLKYNQLGKDVDTLNSFGINVTQNSLPLLKSGLSI